MKQVITLLPLLAVVSIAGAQAAAQAPQRIQFARGRSSAIVKGTTGPYGHTYVLRAKAGQKLVIDVSPAAPVGVKVETEGTFGHEVLLREEEAGGRYEIGLEETGDYTILIGPAGRKPVTFTMSVLVVRMTDI